MKLGKDKVPEFFHTGFHVFVFIFTVSVVMPLMVLLAVGTWQIFLMWMRGEIK